MRDVVGAGIIEHAVGHAHSRHRHRLAAQALRDPQRFRDTVAPHLEEARGRRRSPIEDGPGSTHPPGEAARQRYGHKQDA